jgi:hypothetical protein
MLKGIRMYLLHRRLYLAMCVSLILSIASVYSAVFFSNIPFGTEGAVGILPGIDVSNSSFASIAENSTPSDLAVYHIPYEIKSERPFLIEANLPENATISEAAAISCASTFIEGVFPEEVANQLVVDYITTKLQIHGVLPRWSVTFRNTTIDTPNIESYVFINAISGAVIGYLGEPILKSNPINNITDAEAYAIDVLDYFGFVIPLHTRYQIENYSNLNTMIYSLRFYATVNDVLVDPDFGSLRIQIDGEIGGLRHMILEWMNIQDIPRDGIISSYRFIQHATLSLEAIHWGPPLKMQLIWLVNDYATGEMLYDAFTGELVEFRPYFGEPVHDTSILLIAPVASTLGFAALTYLLGKKFLIKKIRLD